MLDNIFERIVHELLLETHREEKMARARTAAIVVEQKAAESDPSQDEPSSLPRQNVETDAAAYVNGEVHLKGNPLENVAEIRCGKCGLPRLLYPADGVGGRKPEAGKDYCKKRPFIDKPYHDVYGQTYVPEGPGRGKKKKDMFNPLLALSKEGTPDADGISEGPPKPITFPHAKCVQCDKFIPIKRINNHMAKCIGGGGRVSSREALTKIQNGNGTGNQSKSGTPAGSRQPTPNPGNRKSPEKRKALEEGEFDSDSPKKKNKIILNAKPKLKASKNSNLSFEHKMMEDSEDDDGDDDKDGDFESKPPKSAPKPMMKKPKEPVDKKKKYTLPSYAKSATVVNAALNAPATAPKTVPLIVPKRIKLKMNPASSMKREEDTRSESSHTLSSPN